MLLLPANYIKLNEAIATNSVATRENSNQFNKPVNCGATVPRVNLENFRDDNIIGLYCSRTGSAAALISSDAAYTTKFRKPSK